MTENRLLRASNPRYEVWVQVELNDEQQPVRVLCPEGKLSYEIKSIVMRHGLLTIRGMHSNELLSVFYKAQA